MNQTISYVVHRNVAATDKDRRPCKIAMAFVRFPDASVKTVAIPEALIASVPPNKREDFIASEIEAAVGYEVTRLQ